MADTSVFINGAAEGAFTQALKDLPAWATEDTAVTIEGILRKSLDIQTKTLSQLVKNLTGGGASLSPDDLKKANDELDDLIKNLKDQNRENKQKLKDQKEENKEYKKRKKDEEQSSKLTNTALALLAATGKKLSDVFVQSFVTTDALLNAGVNLTAALSGVSDAGVAMQQMVVATNLRLATLQKVIEKYSTTLNAVGVQKFAKAVSLSSKALNEFGLSNEQQAELIGSLIESENSYSDVRNKSAQDIAANAITLGKQLTRLSFTTGQSVEAMADQIKALSKTTDSTIVSAIYGEKSAKNLNTFLSSFGDNKIATDLFQKLAASQVPVLTKSYQDLVKAGEGALAEQLTRIAQYARDTGDAAGAQRQAETLALNVSQGTWKALQIQAAAGNESAASTLDTLTSLRQNATKLSNATEKETDDAIRNKGTRAKAKTEIESVKATPDKNFALLNTQIDYGTNALRKFNEELASITNRLSSETKSWIGMGVVIVSAISGWILAARKLQAYTGIFSKTFNVISRAVGGIGTVLMNGVKGLGSFIRSAGAKVAEVFPQMGSMLRAAWNTVIEGIMASGRFVGNALSSAGSFVAKVFRGAISLVGDAISGAGNWIANMLRSAGALVGDALSGIGGWLSKLGGSIANVFRSAIGLFGDAIAGAGNWIMDIFKGVFGGVGSFFSNIFSKIGGVIGEIMPFLSKIGGLIARFAGVLAWLYTAFEVGYAIGTYLNKFLSKMESVTSVFEAIFRGLDHLLQYIPGSTGSDASDRIAQREKAEKAATQTPVATPTLKPPSTVTVPKNPAPSTINSPSASVLTSNADVNSAEAPVLDQAKQANGTGIEKPAKSSDINSVLGYQSSLQEQILLSINSLVSVNKDILKYTRVN